MIYHRCDGCGVRLPSDGQGHFIVNVEAFAAAGRLEITEHDLQRDYAAEIRRLIAAAARMSADEIEDGVFRKWRFDLCAECHRRFVRDPLARARP